VQEAEFFAAAGFHNILYAVLIEPSKIDRAATIAHRIPHFHVLVDCEGNAPRVLLLSRGCAVPTDVPP
jgi:D-serine deaminase-like pyridoxal phosphate-dependent protein